MGEGITHIRPLRRVVLCLGGLILMGTIGWLLQDHEKNISDINAALQPHRLLFSACRFFIVFCAIGYWDKIACWLYRPLKTAIAVQKQKKFMAQRWRFFLGFCFIELFIANNLFGYILKTVI